MNSSSLFSPPSDSSGTGRLSVSWNMPFTDPCTFALSCAGGAIFSQGLVMGTSNTVIPGAMRFIENTLQVRLDGEWATINTTALTARGSLSDPNPIAPDDGNLTGLNMVETQMILPPNGLELQLGNSLLAFPNSDGQAGQALSTNGLGRLEFRSVAGIAPSVPTSTSDATGSIGNVAWSDSYFFVKTNSGWKRTKLTSF